LIRETLERDRVLADRRVLQRAADVGRHEIRSSMVELLDVSLRRLVPKPCINSD
jgi:hypothetical protein